MKITLYPNPCNTNILHLHVPGIPEQSRTSTEGTLVVSDLVGHVRMRTGYQQEIDVSALANGLYFLEIRNCSASRIGVAKFIISR